MIKTLISKLRGNTLPTSVGLNNESERISWLKDKLKIIPAGNRILDAGAGEQPFKKFCTHLNYVSQDFAQYDPSALVKGLQRESWDYGKLDLICDIASIPEPDASFDAIMCTEVFEHIINPREALGEFSRLTKKGGYLILTSPFSSLTHFAPYHYYTGFNRYFYEQALPDNGFNILEIVPNGNYYEFLAQELRRLPGIAKKYNESTSFTGDQRAGMNELLGLLQQLSEGDKGSSELLCFGYHMLAQKR